MSQCEIGIRFRNDIEIIHFFFSDWNKVNLVRDAEIEWLKKHRYLNSIERNQVSYSLVDLHVISVHINVLTIWTLLN